MLTYIFSIKTSFSLQQKSLEGSHWPVYDLVTINGEVLCIGNDVAQFLSRVTVYRE